MTREEFVKAFAKKAGVSDQYACLGFIETASRTKIALPCACSYKGCEGWAMISIEYVDNHLQFNAPKELKEAYLRSIDDDRHIIQVNTVDHLKGVDEGLVSRMKRLTDDNPSAGGRYATKKAASAALKKLTAKEGDLAVVLERPEAKYAAVAEAKEEGKRRTQIQRRVFRKVRRCRTCGTI